MVFWNKYRPPVASHNLIPVMETVFKEFKRLPEISTKYKLWSPQNPVSFNDIAQGFSLGNCYEVAALSCIANKKGLVEKIFNFD